MSSDVRTGALADLFVPGRSRTKGSLKPVVSRGRGGKLRVHLEEQGEYSVPWKGTMITALRAACEITQYAGPVEVRAEFLFEREYAVRAGNGTDVLRDSSLTPWPTSIVWGDLDKLERNLLDALTQSGLIADDRLVVALQTRKRWAGAGERNGVRVRVLKVEGEA